MTAVAGQDYRGTYTRELGKVRYCDSHDGAVSIKNQHADSLVSLVDERLTYEIEGMYMVL